MGPKKDELCDEFEKDIASLFDLEDEDTDVDEDTADDDDDKDR